MLYLRTCKLNATQRPHWPGVHTALPPPYYSPTRHSPARPTR